MEKAIIINRLSDLKYWRREYSRVYFGNEFCGRLLPNKRELDNLTKFVLKENVNLTLLTPQTDSQTLKLIKKVAEYLFQKGLLKETVVNDYGVLAYIKRKFLGCEIVLGRMLSSFNRLSRGRFLERMGVRRLDFDSLGLLGKCQRAEGQKGLISYYYPYTVIFNGRYCPVASLDRNKLANPGIIKCSKECLEIGELKVTNPMLIKSLVLKGNALFLKNKPDRTKIDELRVDRLVFQPRIPL